MDQPVDNEVAMDTDRAKESPPPKSFKEALTSTSNRDYLFDNKVELLSSDAEDENQENHCHITTTLPDHTGLPCISLPKKLLEKIRKPWINALIV
ncbi:hypothetical protein ACSBR2_016375 [Camellia fascicularis]